MDSFVTVLVICLTAGLAFLLGSLLVVSRLPRAASDSGSDSTTISWNGITLKTSDVFVALTVVSAALALVLPVFALWLNSRIDDMPIFVSAQLGDVTPGDSVAVTHDAWSTDSSRVVLTLFKSRLPQNFTITTKRTGSVQLDARYVWMDKKLVVDISRGGARMTRSIPLDGFTADVGLLSFPAATVPAVAQIHATPASTPRVPATLANVSDPVLPGDSR
jgi:hypothetical protein